MIRAALSPAPGAPAHALSFEEALRWLAVAEDSPDEMLWIDSAAPTSDEIHALERALGLHPLTVEDLTHRNQRAKLEEYPGYLFIVLHWFPGPDATSHPHELHAILGRNWMATVYDDRRIAPVEESWDEFGRGHARPPSGADGEFYRVLDHLVDSHVPVLTAFEDRLERLAVLATQGAGHADLHKVVSVRRALVRFRRALAPQRDVIAALARREHGFISQKSLLWFRDVSDHLQREYETIESLRELAQSVMEVQLAIIERQQNMVIQRLTILSAIFLPLNFLTGFFGMNFGDLPFADHRLLVFALATMVTLPTALLLFFRHKGWIGTP